MIEGVFVHAAAIVETEQIGAGTRIWAFTHIMKGALIGKNCNIGDHCFVESGAKIGDNVTVKNGNMIWDGITLEDGVFVGPHVFFTNDVYPRSGRLPEARKRYGSREWLRPTLVRKGASLGAGAIVLAGVTLDEFCMVGAGAVVTKDIPAHALVVGNPARFRGWVCRCGLPLTFRGERAVCEGCRLVFVRDGNTMHPLD